MWLLPVCLIKADGLTDLLIVRRRLHVERVTLFVHVEVVRVAAPEVHRPAAMAHLNGALFVIAADDAFAVDEELHGSLP